MLSIDRGQCQKSRFADNWGISALRALDELRYLLELGIDPGRLTSTGPAGTSPLYPNPSDDNRSQN